jgi:hypothetical protein
MLSNEDCATSKPLAKPVLLARQAKSVDLLATCSGTNYIFMKPCYNALPPRYNAIPVLAEITLYIVFLLN